MRRCACSGRRGRRCGRRWSFSGGCARRRATTGSVFPVGVGVGLDAGEAVPTEGGYRGGALNLAARLCSVATPGQILASERVVHLAQRVDGVQLLGRAVATVQGDRGAGAAGRGHLGDAAPRRSGRAGAEAAAIDRRRGWSRRRRWWWPRRLAIGVIFVRGGEASSVGLASNSFSLVASDGSASAPLALDESPSGVAVAGKVVWLPRYTDDTVLSVDTATGQDAVGPGWRRSGCGRRG